MAKIKLFFLFLFFCLIYNSVFAKDPTADEIIRNVQKKLDKYPLVFAEFLQTFHWSVAEEIQEFTGQIYIGKQNDFKITTPDQVIVSDGKSVWTTDKVNQQVIIDYLDDSQDIFLPRQLFARYKKEYQTSLSGVEKIEQNDCFHLVLLPKNQDEFIQKLDIWIDKIEWITRKISYLDANDNVTSYLIKDLQLLDKSDPKLFKYTPQSDFEVIDMR